MIVIEHFFAGDSEFFKLCRAVGKMAKFALNDITTILLEWRHQQLKAAKQRA